MNYSIFFRIASFTTPKGVKPTKKQNRAINVKFTYMTVVGVRKRFDTGLVLFIVTSMILIPFIILAKNSFKRRVRSMFIFIAGCPAHKAENICR